MNIPGTIIPAGIGGVSSGGCGSKSGGSCSGSCGGRCGGSCGGSGQHARQASAMSESRGGTMLRRESTVLDGPSSQALPATSGSLAFTRRMEEPPGPATGEKDCNFLTSNPNCTPSGGVGGAPLNCSGSCGSRPCNVYDRVVGGVRYCACECPSAVSDPPPPPPPPEEEEKEEIEDCDVIISQNSFCTPIGGRNGEPFSCSGNCNGPPCETRVVESRGIKYCICYCESRAGDPPPPRERPKPKCGPDITDWLARELEIAQEMGQGAVIPGGLYLLHQQGRRLTYDPKKGSKSGGPTRFHLPRGSKEKCPQLKKCSNTLTLCKKYCINRTEVGNSVYGAMAGAAGLSLFLTNNGVRIGKRLGVISDDVDGPDSPQDFAAIKVGHIMGRGRVRSDKPGGRSSALCSLLDTKVHGSRTTLGGDMSKGAPKECKPCGTAVRANAPHGGPNRDGNWVVPGFVR